MKKFQEVVEEQWAAVVDRRLQPYLTPTTRPIYRPQTGVCVNWREKHASISREPYNLISLKAEHLQKRLMPGSVVLSKPVQFVRWPAFLPTFHWTCDAASR